VVLTNVIKHFFLTGCMGQMQYLTMYSSMQQPLRVSTQLMGLFIKPKKSLKVVDHEV